MNYNAELLKRFGEEIMMRVGLPEEQAKVFVDSLVCADMRGVGSHGISRLRTYAKRIKNHVVDAKAKPGLLH